MANFQLGSSLPEDDEDDEVGTKERRQSLRKKRHYKKDSRFLLDLYTLTFDENEDVDELATCTARLAGDEDDLNGFCFSAPSSPTSIRSRASSALTKVAMPKLSSPISLNLVSLPSAAVGKASSSMQRKSIPCLETNLHKILARKFLDSEEVSFRKAKLLTKAYYQLLRTTNNADIEASKEIQYGYFIIGTIHDIVHPIPKFGLIRKIRPARTLQVATHLWKSFFDLIGIIYKKFKFWGW